MVLDCTDKKVASPVIRPVSINMVNHFSTLELAAEYLFGYIDVFFFSNPKANAKYDVTFLI